MPCLYTILDSNELWEFGEDGLPLFGGDAFDALSEAVVEFIVLEEDDGAKSGLV